MRYTREVKRRSYWLDDEQIAALGRIAERYGCESDSQALRLCIVLVDASPTATITPPPVSMPETPPAGRRPRRQPEETP